MVSVFDYLEHLRNKPKAVRQQVAFWFSVFLTLLILGIWLLNSRLFGPGTDTSPFVGERPPLEVSAATSSPSSFGSRLGQTLKKSCLRIKEGWKIITQ